MSGLIHNYGELRDDEKFINSIENFNKSLGQIERSLLAAMRYHDRNDVSIQDKVKLDNYLLYTINSLYWMHIKIQGTDPNEHNIMNELSRVRQTILRDKEIHERNTIRPVVDKEAAGRFIKRGLHIHYDENGEVIQPKGK